ncbi:MAG: HAMP domain-containing histidine kinase [Defluviitaleaceae bacterium]|nr:HAMP domain-containing histidine kinase [Defluviitaleaceae bacterium]
MEELNRELAARNETLQLYDQMKSNFLAMVAHEINTPLAVIAASSNDTLDLLDEEPINIEEVKQNQVVIERRVKMIDSVVLDLMDKVAIENGRLSLSRQPINLPDLLVTVCETHLQKFDLNNNELIFDFQSDMPAIWADSLRIEQVMVNILTNSFRHTKNGTITVSVKRSDGMQTVSVTDTGEGMDAEMVRVVLKFYISTKTDYWRHGIGLNICRKIVTAHGGDMSIESEEGCGTTVRFSLKEDISDA